MKPGEEVTVTGVLADGGQKIGDFTAARTDTIIMADGRKGFDRAALHSTTP